MISTTKGHINLSVDMELINYMKGLNINLSNTFEEFLKGYMKIESKKENESMPYDQQLMELQKQIEIVKAKREEELKNNVKNMEIGKKEQYENTEIDSIINQIVGNIIKNDKYKNNEWQSNLIGFQNIIKRKLNKFIELYKLKEMIEIRLKERLNENNMVSNM